MARLVCVCILAALLSGCGAIHGMTESSGEFFADHLPAWAGGLPADAPPRPDDPRYAKYVAEQNAKAMQEKQQAPAMEGQTSAVQGQAPR